SRSRKTTGRFALIICSLYKRLHLLAKLMNSEAKDSDRGIRSEAYGRQRRRRSLRSICRCGVVKRRSSPRSGRAKRARSAYVSYLLLFATTTSIFQQNRLSKRLLA